MSAATRTDTWRWLPAARRVAAATTAFWLALVLPVAAAGPKSIGTLTIAGEPGLSGVAVVGYQWEARNSVTPGGGGGTAGKVSFEPFRVVKLVDATSPALLALTFGAKTLEEVRIDVALRRGTTASYVLSKAILTSSERHTAATGGAPLETLSFQAIAIRETVISPGGTVTTCWSLQTVSACD